MEKLKIREAIIVEGKYDKNTISQIVDTLVIETNGFSLFNNKETRDYIKKIAEERGILILTDSDSAGFLIRNKIKDFVDEKYIKNAYIPQIIGKEKRKSKSSKEGFLGVEGIDCNIIRNVIIKSCKINSEHINNEIKYSDLYELGYIGKEKSSEKKLSLLQKLKLPSHINNKDLLKYINNNQKAIDLLIDEKNPLI